jgi:endonuclease G
MLVIIQGLFAYTPSTNEHVRFGTPSKIEGTLLKRKGFVLRYDGAKKNPLWVSYHLTLEHLKNPLKPVFQFKPDPNIYPESNASNDDYAKSPYSRCRLAPLADMSGSKDVMKECFYLTNVCPMDAQLYKGAWKKLEDSIRQFVNKDNECWITAGPVFDKKTKAKIIGRNKVRVPDGFFKVLIYQGRDGAFRAAGFMFDNKKQGGKLQDYLVPINQIEDATGFVFFDKLPEEVGRIIKGEVYKAGDIL